MSLPPFLKDRDLGLLIGRIALGILYVLHGFPKYLGGVQVWTYLGSQTEKLGIGWDALYPVLGFMAATAETVGGVCLLLGFFFRTACFFLVGTMLVAFVSHFPVEGNWLIEAGWPLEMAVVFTMLLFVGPGKYALNKGF